MSFSPNFKRIPYTASERAELAAAQAQEDQDFEESITVLAWTANKGATKIVVKLARSGHGFDLWVGDEYAQESVKVKPVPAEKSEVAAANGIVAVLGTVGLTAERKAVLDAAWD